MQYSVPSIHPGSVADLQQPYKNSLVKACKHLFVCLNILPSRICSKNVPVRVPTKCRQGPVKTLLGAIHLLQGAAKLEADGAEAFKARCRRDWWLLARVAKQSTDADRCCDRVGWNSHHNHTFTVLKMPTCLFTAANSVPRCLFLLEINQWQQVPQCVRMLSDFRRWQQMLLILGERCHLCKKIFSTMGAVMLTGGLEYSSDECQRN